MNPVDAYARDVVAGAIPAGKYHRLACVRHLKDRARENTPGFPYEFVMAKADRFLKFAGLMKHYKGRQFLNKPFEPTPCQVFRLGSTFGWREVGTGYRRFTTHYSELPRKQGKSFEEAVVAVYCTFVEGEAGAEGYCIATKEKQARIAFDAAKKLVKTSHMAKDDKGGGYIKVNAANLHHEDTESKLEPLGSDSDTTDGLNPHFIGVDELHAWKVRGLLDVMESATGSRVNPLMYQITTAGNDPVSVGGDQHDYACRILDGTLDDDPSTLSFFAFIAHADLEDDWLSEDTWKKANPHWGVSVMPEDMRKLAAKAKNMPSAAAEFKQKRLNLWVNSDQPWLSLEGWRTGQGTLSAQAFFERLKGRRCCVGVDLSSKLDLTAVVAAFAPDEDDRIWRYFVKAFTPEDTIKERAHRDRAPYQVWAEQGYLTLTPGTTIEHKAIRDAINQMGLDFDVDRIGFDQWNIGNMLEMLKDDGWSEEQLIAIPQTYAHLSAPAKDFEAEVLDGRADANGNPLMTWCVSNVVVQKDGKDNIQPIKKKSRGRIDPVVAGIMARKLADFEEGPVEDPDLMVITLGS